VLPIFHISSQTADVLLGASDLDVAALQREVDKANGADQTWAVKHLHQVVRMRLRLAPVRTVEAVNVLGVWEGSDAQLNDELVLVSTHYDNPGREPDGTSFTAANDGASGVGVMLEIVRLWYSSGFQPRRTVYFVAWAGGEWEHGGAHEYLRNQAIYSVRDLAAVVNLNGLGRGGPTLLASGSAKLLDLLQRAGSSSGVAVRQGQSQVHPYHEAFASPTITVGWSDDHVPATADTAETLNDAQLGSAGQVINLALITLAREYDY
jgi:hypothetical protein